MGRLLLLLCTLFSAKLVASPGTITMGDKEPSFPVLQTRTGAYTNVTVTKRTKDWIFIIHATGVCNIKASDLSPETRVALGYDAPPQKDTAKNGATASSGTKDSSQDDRKAAQPLAQLAHFKLSVVRNFANEWRINRKEKIAECTAFINENHTTICIILAITGIVYIFVTTCFWLICRKTHIAPGPLVWVPFFQLIPLMRAANMPLGWFFAFFIPPLAIIALIVLAVKIVKSRGKNPWVAFLLIMPPTTVFAFLYLAFSRSAPVKIESNDILALETA